ncbi:sensor histidine kinase [Oleiharenicola lentus]|uniref:sensor histidine kinase n=1 Tax=Oleiharenicola lentus TaxID=2508720 RepID=UPI003F66778C
MSSETSAAHRTGNLYGSFAYALVVVTCYAGFLNNQRYYTSEWMVPVVFVCGAIYATLGVLGGTLLECNGRMSHALYYLIQCSLLTAIIFLSPVRGFLGILVLPAMSQAIFDLRPRYAALIGVYLFGINIALWAIPYGWQSGLQAIINYSAAFTFTIAFTLITKQALNSREREEKLRHELEDANALLRANASQAEDLATTRERNRVAREIHDGVGHYLTVVKTQLDAAAALLPAHPEKARDAVVKAAKLSGDALDDVRRSVGALRTDAERPPLPEALRTLTHEAGLPVTLKIEGVPRTLPPGIEHALFRSAQEGLTNIRKHSAATESEVTLHFRDDGRVTLTVADNGRGASTVVTNGFGLLGIRERIEVLGGRVASGNRSTGGFSLSVEVPA